MYASVSPIRFTFCEGHTVLDQLAATSLRSTLLGILDDLEQKEAVVQKNLGEKQSQQVQKERDSDEMISESKKNVGEVQVTPALQVLTNVTGICSQKKDVSGRQGLEMKLPHTKEQSGDTAIYRVGIIDCHT